MKKLKHSLMFFLSLCLLLSSFVPVIATELSSVDVKVPSVQIPIYEKEELKEILYLPFGEKEHEIGYYEGGYESLSQGPTSYFVRNGNIYILDNVNQKVVIQRGNIISEFPLKEMHFGADLYVTEDQTLYVLDIGSRHVHQYDASGSLVVSTPIPGELEIPTALSMDSNKNILVRQGSDHSVTLEGTLSLAGRQFENTTTSVKPFIINDKLGRLVIEESNSTYSIDIPYEHSFGELILQAVLDNQIVYDRTEVAPDTYTVMAESFIEVSDKKGMVQGAARIPLEKMVFVPNHVVRVDNTSLYLLSVEKEGLRIYDVKVGKQYEKRLQNRIDNYVIPDNLKIAPQEEIIEPDNDNSLNSLIKNGYIYRYEASSRADAMINHRWTLKSGNQTEAANTKLPTFVKNGTVGTTFTGIPYTYGGGDGVDVSVPGRKLFSEYQNTDSRQTGNVLSNSVMSVTGLDCSGFVGIAWYRVDQKYGTSTINNITHHITKSNMKQMDAFNSSGWHTLLLSSQSTETVYSKEATSDGSQRAQNYSRTWKWIEGANSRGRAYEYIRYDRILDNDSPRPEPYVIN